MVGGMKVDNCTPEAKADTSKQSRCMKYTIEYGIAHATHVSRVPRAKIRYWWGLGSLNRRAISSDFAAVVVVTPACG